MYEYEGIRIGFVFSYLVVEGQPIIRRMTDKLIVLEHPYVAMWNDGMIMVPEGFLSDLSSIPRVLQNVLPKTGLHDGPSIIHDWCYVYKWRHNRKACDYMFLRAMEVAGVHWFRRFILWAGVRIGGWVPW